MLLVSFFVLSNYLASVARITTFLVFFIALKLHDIVVEFVFTARGIVIDGFRVTTSYLVLAFLPYAFSTVFVSFLF